MQQWPKRRLGRWDPQPHPGPFPSRATRNDLLSRSSRFDAAFCECSLSLFLNKAQAVEEVERMLRPGGRFGLSDVAVEPNNLLEEVVGTVGRILCLADAVPVDGYVGLLQAAGFRLVHQENASTEITSILDNLETKLSAFLAWGHISGQAAPELGALGEGFRLIADLRGLVQAGTLRYWLFVAEKPG